MEEEMLWENKICKNGRQNYCCCLLIWKLPYQIKRATRLKSNFLQFTPILIV